MFVIDPRFPRFLESPGMSWNSLVFQINQHGAEFGLLLTETKVTMNFQIVGV